MYAAAIAALLVAYFIFRRWIQGRDSPDQTTRLDGKTVVITGCNTGLGFETAVELAARGAHLIMACRDQNRAEAAAATLRQRVPSADVRVMSLDLCSFASVRAFASLFMQTEKRLDVLLCNAGAMMFERKMTGDNLETSFQANHFSHFLLVSLLMPMLRRAPHARIINVSSLMHAQVKTISFDDLSHEKNFRGFEVYGETKLANVLFTFELARRLKGTNITANCLHPGTVVSDIPRNMHKVIYLLYPLYAQLFCKSTIKGAQTSIWAAVDPKFDTTSGVYLDDCAIVPSSKASKDEGLAKKLWEVSEQITGAKWDL
jgi:NAD(P)-dependent dehydrogenase (short-subunit alcohol dehydrogenase family)